MTNVISQTENVKSNPSDKNVEIRNKTSQFQVEFQQNMCQKC
jgi:hypothetical protein